jgi:hypothetical protein
MVTSVAAAPPNVTVAPAPKFVPVIVTLVPPAVVPAFGAIAVMVGVLFDVEGWLGDEGDVGLPGESLPPQLVMASAIRPERLAMTMFASFRLRRTCTALAPRSGLGAAVRSFARLLRLGRSIISDRRASRISRMRSAARRSPDWQAAGRWATPAVDAGGVREAR